MRALLVVNPKATTTTEKVRHVLTRALASDLDVEVAETRNRGHAAALACRAAREGLELVVALGGDGTVNEVVNGLLTDGTRPDLPALAVVPGGSTNVFARSLGLSNDPVEATGEILAALRAGHRQQIGLGLANDRWFTFNAGYGYDAEVVHRMERRRRKGDPTSHIRYVRTALTQFFAGTDRRHPVLTLHRAGHKSTEHLFFAIVSNTSPWTYLGNRPVNPNPGASFRTGLDLFAPRRMGTLRTLYYLGQVLRSSPRLRHRRGLVRLHDLDEFTITASRPMDLQVDGDHLGRHDEVTFTAVPQAITVIAPAD